MDNLAALVSALQAVTLDVSSMLDWQPSPNLSESLPSGADISALLSQED